LVVSWLHKRPTLLGTVTGAVVGLVAITPAAGYVTPVAGIAIGAIAAIISYYGMVLFKIKRGVDDSLDVFACHGLGGIWGCLATGIFASAAVNGAGFDGLIYGNGMQFVKQLVDVATVGAYAFGVTWVLGKLIDITIGLRVGQQEETVGLDLSQHGERAYGGMLR
jgi:Amt family ammonium transporter